MEETNFDKLIENMTLNEIKELNDYLILLRSKLENHVDGVPKLLKNIERIETRSPDKDNLKRCA